MPVKFSCAFTSKDKLEGIEKQINGAGFRVGVLEGATFTDRPGEFSKSPKSTPAQVAMYLEFGVVQKITKKQARYLAMRVSKAEKKLHMEPGSFGFGTGKGAKKGYIVLPARPYFRPTLKMADRWVKVFANTVNHMGLTNKKTLPTALHYAARMAEADLVDNIRKATSPELSPLTKLFYAADGVEEGRQPLAHLPNYMSSEVFGPGGTKGHRDKP